MINNTPLFATDAISWLETNIKKTDTVFEYGSGGSTLFFSKLCSKLISIEHDIEWYKKIQEIIIKEDLKNIDYYLIKPEQNFNNLLTYTIENYTSQDGTTTGCNLKKYVTFIDTFNEKFDFISIDGRARPSCIKHSINKIKKGGYIILDDSQRKEYEPSIKKYLDFEPYLIFSDSDRCTTIWRVL